MARSADRVLPVVGVAMLVAALVLGVGVVKKLSRADDPPARGAAGLSAAESPAGVTDLDLGPTDARERAACAAPGFDEVLYAERQLRFGGTSGVLVLRNAAGQVRLCDRFGSDTPSEAPLPTPTNDDPVVFLSNGRSAWTCDGTTLQRFEQSTWLAVTPDVATVRERFWVDGVPGTWFQTAAQGGYAHLQTWLQGPRPDSRYAQQFQVLDAGGAVVPQTALPTGRTPLSGCRQHGSAEIG